MTTVEQRRMAVAGQSGAAAERYYQRFDRRQRATHAFLMLSFIGLALTGLPLRFADHDWARALASLWGGIESAGFIHRVCAVVMIGAFASHVGQVLWQVYRKHDYGALWGPTSMVPQPRDVVEMYRHMRWFVGLGARPAFDRFTYWEKFDYWAVFWGMLIIGGSGLMLWFPEVFALALPGWIFNIALLIHGEEALLAVGFIFTIHFFNGHIRPEKFPMDLVIFTGRVSEHELKEERPAEHERLARDGRLGFYEAAPPSPRSVTFGRVFGTAAVVLGLTTVVLIVFALLQ